MCWNTAHTGSIGWWIGHGVNERWLRTGTRDEPEADERARSEFDVYLRDVGEVVKNDPDAKRAVRRAIQLVLEESACPGLPRKRTRPGA
jgi:hypothetical protein